MAPSRNYADFLRAWPLLEPSMAILGPTHTIHHVRERWRTGQAELWMGDQSAILTEAITHPTGLRSLSVWLQGGELPELKEMHPAIEEWARAQACDQMIAWGRDGWVKALNGWQACGTRRRKVLIHD